MSTLIEKTKKLRLSQESVSGFGNEAPLSDDELDISVIPLSGRGKALQKEIENPSHEACAKSQQQVGSSSAVSDASSLHRQDAIDEGAGSNPTRNPTTREGADPKEAKTKRVTKGR